MSCGSFPRVRSVKVSVMGSWRQWVLIGLLFAAIPALRAQDPKTLREEANELTKAGNYAEALQKHIEFQEQARRVRALAGVRLSFALAEWISLGDLYPPARVALIERGREFARRLLAGEASSDVFQEVRAINRALEQDEETLSLFRQLHREKPEVALKCFRIARDVLIQQGDDDLLFYYRPDPLTLWKELTRSHERHLDAIKRFGAGEKSEPVRNAKEAFEKAVLQLLDYSVRAGEPKAAERIRNEALKLHDSAAIRSAPVK